MGKSANITAAVFAAYLECPTKAYLAAHGENTPDTFFADTRGRISAAYRAMAIQNLRMGSPGVAPIDFLRLIDDPIRNGSTLFVDCASAILAMRSGVIEGDFGRRDLSLVPTMSRSSILPGRRVIGPMIFSFALVPWQSGRRREPEFRQVGKSFMAKPTALRPSESPTTSRKPGRSSRQSRRSATLRNHPRSS